ncbi:MAG: hypothetical protein M3354_05880 [Chloroflexota bacterium]|nr:hypothetical protein [Chloroflexota bacterium]
MATRTNACSELARFWLEARHGCLVTEGVPVKVPYGHSDIDLLALQPLSTTIQLPNEDSVCPRLIVEAKDEHDWEPTGDQFGQLLRADMTMKGSGRFIPKGSKGVKFSMLREQHFQQATTLFGSDDFDRLFVVHAIAADVLAELGPALAERRIYWVTIP